MPGIISGSQREIILESICEAHRYIRFCKEALKRDKEETGTYYATREMGQVKRSSMDLSRVLAKVRK